MPTVEFPHNLRPLLGSQFSKSDSNTEESYSRDVTISLTQHIRSLLAKHRIGVEGSGVVQYHHPVARSVTAVSVPEDVSSVSSGPLFDSDVEDTAQPLLPADINCQCVRKWGNEGDIGMPSKENDDLDYGTSSRDPKWNDSGKIAGNSTQKNIPLELTTNGGENADDGDGRDERDRDGDDLVGSGARALAAKRKPLFACPYFVHSPESWSQSRACRPTG